MQLLRLGIKPVSKDALYDKSALEAIRSVPGKGRPRKPPEKPLFTRDPAPEYEFPRIDTVEIPLLGTTAAGQAMDFGDLDPNPPTRPWSAALVKGKAKEYYCVLVKGASMTEAGIKNGDYALLRHTEKPENGEIMLVRHADSSTLKRIKLVEDGEVYLCWEDGSGKTIRVDDEDYEIQGTLAGIEHKQKDK